MAQAPALSKEEKNVKKKLLILIAMLLCVVTVLASCASTLKFRKLVGDGAFTDEAPTLTSATRLDMKGTAENTGDLVVFRDTDLLTGLTTHTAYNLATGATLCIVSDSDTVTESASVTVRHRVELVELRNTALAVVSTTTETVGQVDGAPQSERTCDVKVLTAIGKEVVVLTDVAPNQVSNAWAAEDLFCIADKVYRITEEGDVDFTFEWNDLRRKPINEMGRSLITKYGDYYITINDEGIAIYDGVLNLVMTHWVPSYGLATARVFVLANGNVLVQYWVPQDPLSEEYDMLWEGDKCDLYSYRIDAKSGKVKELKTDYLVAKVWDITEMDFYHERVENLAVIHEIEDQRVDISRSAGKLVSLGNSGKIDGYVEELIPNMAPELPVQVSTNRWILTDLAERQFLVNERGDVIGEVTGIDLGKARPDFFLLNNKIYDWDLNVKADLAEEKLVGDYKVMDHGVLFGAEGKETKLYAGGEVKTIIDRVTAEAGKRIVQHVSSSLYVIIDIAVAGVVKYELYNDIGILLTVVDNVSIDPNGIVYTAESTNAVLIKARDGADHTVYYRIA